MINGKYWFLSWGYWFSSRSLGLLIHPYVTMRAIVRERFMRPLAVLPSVIWVLSWLLGEVLIRLGRWWGLGRFDLMVVVARGLVFLWLWGTLFLLVWQVVLLYLYRRFRRAWSE